MSRFKILIALAAMGLSMSNEAQAEKLVLLNTNDTHSQIDAGSDNNLGGVARRKVAIDSIRAVNDNVLLIDAGDIVQGTLFFNLYKGEVEEKVMNALGYDLRILGNHEFDNGMQALADQLAVAEAELLCSNYNFRGTPLDSVFKPYAMREIGGKRVAFMPLNLKPQGMISNHNFAGAKYLDYTQAANGLAWYLKNIENADMVIAITHLGYDDDVALIEQSHDIDALIGGHSHTQVDPADAQSVPSRIKNADGREILVVQTGGGGKHLGEMIIDLDSIGANYVPEYKSLVIDNRYDDRIDGDFIAMLAPYREQVIALNTDIVGKSASYLDRKGTQLLNFMADFVYDRGKELAGKVDLAITNKGGLRNSLPAGNVSKGDLIRIMPFDNRVRVIEVTGDSLLEAFNTMARAGGQGVSANVEARYDRKEGKAYDVRISGKPIDLNRTYRLATIDYLADGGDYFHSLADNKTLVTSSNMLYDDLADYLRTGKYKGKVINPSDKLRMHP